MRVALIALAGALVLAAPRVATACSVCFGDPDSPVMSGVRLAIVTLIGFLGLVYLGIGKVLWDIRKRTRRLQEGGQPESRR